MPKSETFTRMNISLLADLKAEMDGCKADVNWSAVATEAFRRKLKEIESMAPTETMMQVVERFRAAVEVEENEMKQRGAADGIEWTKNKARPRELKRLEKWADSCTGREDWRYMLGVFANTDLNRGIGRHLAEVFTGNDDLDAEDAKQFWEQAGVSVDDIEEYDYAEAFVEAALDTWNEIQRLMNKPMKR